MESLEAAVRSGADAVYLGSTEFSARRNAQNFNNEELKQAVDYCHIRGVRVYLTLNIMLKSSEIEAAVRLAEYANNIGVDGIILQDLGLSYILSKRFPDIKLHASTQMTIHEKSALPFLKRMGFSRVVLSREMSKSEIKEFCAAAKEIGIEVEMFVHGALCMCVSGQCLLSAVLGSRSGNRGLCAGPCRLPFAASGGTGYDLSLKDLSLADEISELYGMGVASLKIEGRMKRPEYVAAATHSIRQAVDTGVVDNNMSSLLKSVFSRSGFTKGYYEGKLGKEMFGTRTKDDVLSSGDAFSSLHELYRNERQSVAVTVSVDINQNEKIKLLMSDGEHSVCVFGDYPQKAQNKPTDKEAVIRALSKLGGTPYYAEKIDVNLNDGLFVPGSLLNSLRREATELLGEKRAENEERRNLSYEFLPEIAVHNREKLIARFINPEQIPKDIKSLYGICLPSQYDFPNLPEGIIKITDTPRYIKDGEALLKRLSFLKENGVDYAMCGNISGVLTAKKAGMTVIGDIGLNVSNSHSADVLKREGVFAITLSAEMTLKDIEKLNTPLKKGIFAYGRLPLMLTRNCPLKNGRNCDKCDKNGTLTDRLGIEFPVRCRKNYSELFNSSPIFFADKLNDIRNVDYLLLSFTDESAREAETIIEAYTTGKPVVEKYTRGLYYKGVM